MKQENSGYHRYFLKRRSGYRCCLRSGSQQLRGETSELQRFRGNDKSIGLILADC